MRHLVVSKLQSFTLQRLQILITSPLPAPWGSWALYLSCYHELQTKSSHRTVFRRCTAKVILISEDKHTKPYQTIWLALMRNFHEDFDREVLGRSKGNKALISLQSDWSETFLSLRALLSYKVLEIVNVKQIWSPPPLFVKLL